MTAATSMDFILEISLGSVNEDVVLAHLYLTASTGSTIADNVIRAYFDTAVDRAEAVELLAGFDMRAVDAERQDWLTLYEQSLEPLFIGRSFLVAPDASLFPADDLRYKLVIPQEQAFGTGSHETTSLCIELLETLQFESGLDIGTGSGILALAMKRLGAKRVVAFDNDLDAYAALRENQERNDLRVAAFIGGTEALRGGSFDVITMNILPDVIVELLPQVMRHVKRELILSGILISRKGDVIAAARGLSLVDERTRGEWWAGRFTLPAL
jgi:ribosomal protein L11 methyltransferase